jgi:hypothetical protein
MSLDALYTLVGVAVVTGLASIYVGICHAIGRVIVGKVLHGRR